MPNLERWAARSFVGTRALSPAGWTAPAHASIFSGLTVSLHGVHYSPEPRVFSTGPMAGVSWLPSLLSAEGYECVAVTANHLALPAENMGFHRVLAPHHRDFLYTLGAIGDRKLPFALRLSESLGWRLPYADAKEITNITMRAFPEWKRPVFLFINMLDAHSPYNPPSEALRAIKADSKRAFPRYSRHRTLTGKWDALPEGKDRYLKDLYDGELRWIDMQLARLLPFLTDRLGESSLYIVTSDHGEDLGENGVVGHEIGLSQRLLHVPLIIRGPGIRVGRNSRTVTLRRLFEFILLHGKGQAPGVEALMSRDDFSTIAERYPSTTESHDPRETRPWVVLVEDGIKGMGPSAYGWELQDLESSGFRDAEALQDTGQFGHLRRFVDGYWERYQDRPSAPSHAPTPEQLERLRSLGYI